MELMRETVLPKIHRGNDKQDGKKGKILDLTSLWLHFPRWGPLPNHLHPSPRQEYQNEV